MSLARALVDDAGRRVSLPLREVAQLYRLFNQQAPPAEQVERLLAEPGVAPR
jgi:hypothetical protein